MEGSDLPARSTLPATVALLLLSLLVPVVVRLMFYKQVFITKTAPFRPRKTFKFHTMVIEVTDIVRVTIYRGSELIYSATVGTNIPCHAHFTAQQSDGEIMISFASYATLRIKHVIKREKTATVGPVSEARSVEKELPEGETTRYYEVNWMLLKSSLGELEEHVDMPGSHWYGGGHVFRQHWPMEKWDTDFAPYVTGEAGPVPSISEYYGGVQERFWFNSNGVSIFVPSEVPLFASINYDGNKLMRLKAMYRSPYRNVNGKELVLSYSLCVAKEASPKAAFQASASTFFKTPSGIPDEDLFRHPVWSTWALHKTNVSQAGVLEMAQTMKKHGFKASQLEIDDGWAVRYGDNVFDQTKFPDPYDMMRRLKEMGFRVTLWVHPFASFFSKAFAAGLKHNAWVRRDILHLGLTIRLPTPVSWWNGYSAMLDVTNPAAVDWFRSELLSLKTEYGVSSFKVDAGDGHRLSSWTRLFNDTGNPNDYTRKFAEMVFSLDPDQRSQELRVGVSCQHLPMFYRLQDKDSNWGDFNGLKTVIPHVMTQGLLGYPFILPDMIGGNAYNLIPFTSTRLPDRELYVRWVQLNALLPAMQFSIPPWLYDEEVVNITRSMCSLHEQTASLFITLAREATKTGAPIIRPLWWLAPRDPVALTISTQFLVGDHLLVAPVLEKGARSRDIYLPRGSWKDELSNNIYEGGRWCRDYPVDLRSLARFTRLDS